MSREHLERRQVWYYLAAVLIGLGLGSWQPGAADRLDLVIWPLLAVLLFTTFTQIPLRAVPAAFAERRFLVAAVLGNFVFLPLLAWVVVSVLTGSGLSGDAPTEVVRLGLLLVLLVPCTDWFITFTQLGRGDPALATALTPVSLLLQLLLLPFYLWLMTGEAAQVITVDQMWPAVLVVLGPLLAAGALDRWLGSSLRGERVRARLAWGPVPLLAAVLLVVAASQVGQARDALQLLPVVAAAALVFLLGALLIALALSRGGGLSVGAGRTLAFALATRNSFVVLPFAIALPAGWEVAALVIVLQSLIELFAMSVCVWFVPRVLMPDHHEST